MSLLSSASLYCIIRILRAGHLLKRPFNLLGHSKLAISLLNWEEIHQYLLLSTSQSRLSLSYLRRILKLRGKLLTSDMETAEKPKVIYRCKKCRRIVASEESVIPHEQGEGEKCFKWKHRDSNWSEKKPQCTAIFVEPMKWMRAVEEGNSAEKLLCIGCEARLGSFNWAGMQCSCGTWVNPAFQIVKSKVDESTT